MNALENKLFEQLWAKMTGRPVPCTNCLGPLPKSPPSVETLDVKHEVCSLPCAMQLATDVMGMTGESVTIYKGNR